MIYGLGDGINRLSLMTANTKDRVLRATEFSAQGALFMGAWDPVGVDGFTDVYSNFIWNVLYASTFLGVGNPVTGLPDNETVVVDWNSINTKVVERNGEVVGDLSVPSNAVLYNTTSKRWEPVGSGVKTMSTLTETVKLWRWHSGHMMSMADVVGYIGFNNEWAKQDGPNDRYYDASYSSASIEGINTRKGYVFDPQRNQVKVYDDYNFPADKLWLAGNLAVGAGTSNFCYPIPWQLREALGRMVAEGSASGTVYSFTGGKATDIDVLNPTCVSDIRAELVKMRDQRYIPPYIRGYTTESEALEGYNAIIKFIDDRGHTAISNGAFYLERYDARGPSITLKRWNDFPYPPEYWFERFSTEIPRVDRIDTPIAQRGRDASVAVRVSDVQYPEGSSRPSTTSKVSVTLALPEGSRTYDARHQSGGVYIVTIPAKDLEGINPGSYVVMATATNREGHMASGSTNMLLRG
jgi:peptide/nickel transport system substrate-binding protein